MIAIVKQDEGQLYIHLTGREGKTVDIIPISAILSGTGKTIVLYKEDSNG